MKTTSATAIPPVPFHGRIRDGSALVVKERRERKGSEATLSFFALRAFLRCWLGRSSPSDKLVANRRSMLRTLAALVLPWLVAATCTAQVWDYGDGRHGSFVLTTNATIEQLYQAVRLPSDPEQFNPTNSTAIPNLLRLTITDGAVLTADPWNGNAGGRIVLKVQGTLFVAAGSSITVTGIGFRGGVTSQQGESYTGDQAFSSNRNFGGGGGGYTASTATLPGGGGGYGTSGDPGFSGNSDGGKGGDHYGTESLDVVFLGSGGGGGYHRSLHVLGGNGGGAIALNAGRLQVEGRIAADGGGGGDSNGTGGGGGSGGSIKLQVNSAILGAGSVTANGGQGGSGGGANGGAGRIRLEFAESYSGETMPTASVFSDSTSDNLTVITSQPTARTNAFGSTAVFSVGFRALSPYTIQWSFKGASIPDATNRVLSLPSVDLTHHGDYSVAIANAVMTAISSNAFLTVLDIRDFDGDGINNNWEQQFGLDSNNPADANTKRSDDRLTYLQKFLSDLDPLTPDSDGDSLEDFDELFVHGTNPRPLFADTDGDGMPDNWELDHGLNPRMNDGEEDLDHDGLTNLQEYQKRADGYLPDRADSFGGNRSDYERLSGEQTNRFYYDRNDRLIGADYNRGSNGFAIAYVYDDNGNLLRQKNLARDTNHNSLPDLWEFLNGLTNNANAFADNDGDRWSDWQEWKAGSKPTSFSSVPEAPVRKALARLELPFVPTNWVVIAAQLDGLGTEELIVGADGNANGVTNLLFILNETHPDWGVKSIPIGPYGVTSLAFGTVNNRNEPAIYAGLRSTGGQGRILEIRDGQVPVQTLLPIQSMNEAVFLLGINTSNRLVVSLADATTGPSLLAVGFQPDGSVTRTVIVTNWQGEGFGTVGTVYSRILRDAYAQVSGSAQVLVHAYDSEVTANEQVLPRNAAQDPADGKWHFWLEQSLTWPDARTVLHRYGSDFVVIETGEKNGWLINQYHLGGWIGIMCQSSRRSFWIDGDRADRGFLNWQDGVDYGDCSPVQAGYMIESPGGAQGKWSYDNGVERRRPSLAQVNVPVALYTNRWSSPLMGPSESLLHFVSRPVLQPFRPGQTNSASLVCALLSQQSGPDDGDSFELLEFLISDNTITTNTWFKALYPKSDRAANFALTLAQPVLNLGRSLFTAEPGGQIFMWIATNATAPLERQLFDAQHLGHSWKGMAGLKMAAAGDSLTALRAVSTNEAAVDVFLWPPRPVLETPTLQSFPQTAPAAVVLPSPSPLGSFASMTVRLWDAEGNSATPYLQYQLSGSANWTNATILLLDGSPYSTNSRVAALPSGTNYTLVWNAVGDLGAGVTTNVLLRAQASDITLLGEWSASTPFTVETTANPDSDNDGLLDSWEIQNFVSTAANPDDDPDEDGFKNSQEYVADTKPTDKESFLQITRIQPVDDGVQIEWKGGSNAVLYLQRRDDLNTGSWLNIRTNFPPTPVSGIYIDSYDMNASRFYRIEASRLQ